MSLQSYELLHTAECTLTKVSRALTESLVTWGVLLMALFAFAQKDPGAAPYAIVTNGYLQFLLIASTYVVTAAEFGIVLGAMDGLGSDCDYLQPGTVLVMRSVEVLGLILTAGLVVANYVKLKRCARLVGAAKTEGAVHLYHHGRGALGSSGGGSARLACSLNLVCGLAVALISPHVTSDLYHAAVLGRVGLDDWHVYRIAFSGLWHVNNTLLLPVLFCRHRALRLHCLRLLCRKCVVCDEEEEDEFRQSSVDSRYDTVTPYQHLKKQKKPDVAAN